MGRRSIPAGAQWQFVENLPLCGGFSWALGIDGIALMLIMLSVFLMPICIGASWRSIDKRVPEYMAAFLLMEALMLGVFAAQDLFLFYIFFEAGLIPMYLIIGIWGGAERINASYKFFLYTLLGSVLMLVAMLCMVTQAKTTSIPVLMAYDFPVDAQKWLWLAFFASFAVKMPMWPVHTWLPDAHVQAPTAGSVILAGVLLKMGGYGFIRFSLPMFPEGSAMFVPFVFALSGIAVVYTSLVALVQTRHEEADRLFVGRAHGVRDLRPVRLQPTGHRRRDDGHARPRPGVGRALPVRRRDLRPAAHPRDRQVRRPLEQHAGLRFAIHALHHGERWPAGHEQLRRRIPEPGRDLQGVELGCDRRDDRHHPRRGLHALSLLAHRLRRCPHAEAAAMVDLSAREWWLLAPIAAGVFWMGIYPESFIRPFRGDVARVVERIDRAAPAGDLDFKPGRPQPKAEHHAAEAAH